MSMRLPSLNALRAFEAAARHESFARAAEALFVTEGAVSRHVKLLEEDLGVPLFRRLTRKVELTPAGRDLYPVISGAFQSMADGVQRAAARALTLKVASGPSFSIRWLVPRLERFRRLHPDIQVVLTTAVFTWEDLLDDYDMGLSCGDNGIPPVLTAERVLPSRLTPVCVPRLAEGLAGNPLDMLASVELLHSTADRLDWRTWSARCLGGRLNVDRGQAFDTLDMAIKAATFGEGVVIGDLALIGEELASGALVAPYPDHVAAHPRDDYYVVFRSAEAEEPRIAAFRAWLKGESEAAANDAE
jgi:LysR family transcriptional regulator, glycine cleavage system transcriptional activator